MLAENVSTALDRVRIAAGYPAMSGNELAAALVALEVPFIAGGPHQRVAAPPQPAVLLASLATSDEARLRLALIPLLLHHSEYADHAAAALHLMPPAAQTCFKCYYTAAMLLQRKHRVRLEALGRATVLLPDLFCKELGVSERAKPEHALKLVAMRQRVLTGRPINWQGTYEHGAEGYLKAMERRQQWQAGIRTI